MEITLNIKYILQHFAGSFYTLSVMMVLNVILIILLLRKKNKPKLHWLFMIYAICALAEDILTLPFDKPQLSIISPEVIEIFVIAFVWIEFITFYSFFHTIFHNDVIIKTITITRRSYVIFSLLIIILYFLFFFSILDIRTFSGFFSVVTSALLIAPSFYYIYTVFRDPPNKALFQEPAFWINTGIIFSNSINIPLFVVDNYLSNEPKGIWSRMYALNYIGYIVLFTFFNIALLLKPISQNPR